MASIGPHKKGYRAQVCVKGIRDSQVFATKREAAIWAAARETELRATGDKPKLTKTFGNLLEKYRDEISPTKGGERWEVVRINKILKDPIADIKLAELDSPHFADWRDRRLAEISAESVRREWNLLSAACTIARKEWRWLENNPMSDAKRPPKGEARERRITQDEIDRLLFVVGNDPTTQTGRTGLAFLFAIETAMRAGEIVCLKWADIQLERKFLTVTGTEQGGGKTQSARRDVPLSAEAIAILNKLPRLTEYAFAISSSNLDAIFRKAKDKAGITDLHFHDTRHEGITRLAKKLEVLALARAIGHRDLKQLLVYYNESAEDMAGRL